MAHRISSILRVGNASTSKFSLSLRVCRKVSLIRHLSASPRHNAKANGSTNGNAPPQAQAVNRDERRRVSILEEDPEELWEQLEDDSDVVDSPSGGHILLEQHRQLLHYLRLIEHEMPKLVAYRKPFVPPASSTPIIVRALNYQGEAHPVEKKRAIVVPIDQLPLNGPTAIHKIKLLAGPRWTPIPPKDAGLGGSLEDNGNGYIKISCEDFPTPGANLKWTSDTLDKLISEANDTKDTFADVPLDLRHVYAKVRKGKKGDHLRDRPFHRPSIRDFPQEWLLPVEAKATNV